MAMVMLGAMFQLVPVISGQMIPGGVVVATAVHLLLLIGVALMAAGFMVQRYEWLALAGLSLLLAFATFLLPLASLLLRRIGGGDAIFTIRLAALPHMGLIIPELYSRWQFRLHFAALLMLVMATLAVIRNPLGIHAQPCFHLAKKYGVQGGRETQITPDGPGAPDGGDVVAGVGGGGLVTGSSSATGHSKSLFYRTNWYFPMYS